MQADVPACTKITNPATINTEEVQYRRMNKKKNQILIFFVVSWFFQWTVSPFADAHGTGYQVLNDSNALTLEFRYSDGEPMSYAEVLVFSPEDEKSEYQSGRTDRKGRFAFYPDKKGKWIIEANDEMGHKARAEIDRNPVQSSPHQPEQSRASKKTGIIAGLSLILNLAFIFHLFKKRKNSAFHPGSSDENR